MKKIFLMAVAIMALTACEKGNVVDNADVETTSVETWKLSTCGDTIFCDVEEFRIPVMVFKTNPEMERYNSLRDMVTLEEVSSSCTPLVECAMPADLICMMPLIDVDRGYTDEMTFCREVTFSGVRQTIYFVCKISAERIPGAGLRAFVECSVRAMLFEGTNLISWAAVRKNFNVEDYTQVYLFH